MTIYRERREARAEQLREWAGKRDDKAAAAFEHAERISSMIPFGQPILVGHHSEGRHRRDLDRIERGMRAGIENERKADDMRRRADGIKSQLQSSIYSDDPDAIERLEERIADLEAERERVKVFNTSCRKGEPDWSILTEDEKADLLRTAEVASFQVVDRNGKFKGYPTYVLSNLSGNIKRNRDRLAQLRRVAEHGERPRWITARFDSDCAGCGTRLEKGSLIAYYRIAREAKCRECAS